MPISSINKASLEHNDDGEGRILYRIQIAADQGVFPLTGVFTSKFENQSKKVQIINQFIKTPEISHLEIKQDYRWTSILFFIIFGGFFGLLFICFNEVLVFDFDKSTNEFRSIKYGFLRTKIH